jgi:hypothetical protein
LRLELLKLKDQYFPALLKRPDISEEEKQKIKQLLTRKFNPYIFRHSSLTRLSGRVNEQRLKQHAGWTKTSDMIEIYTHEMPNDTYEDIMLAFGVDVKDKKQQQQQIQQQLRGKICPHCNMENLPNAQFCSECKLVLTLEMFNESMKEAEQTKNELKEVKEEIRSIKLAFSTMVRTGVFDYRGATDDFANSLVEEEKRRRRE